MHNLQSCNHLSASSGFDFSLRSTGWSCYTYYGHSLSDELADCLYKTAKEHLPGHKLRTDNSDSDPDYEAPFYILKYTYAAAVLTENGFIDNELSLSFLESDKGKEAIIALHVDGIIDFVAKRAGEPV